MSQTIFDIRAIMGMLAHRSPFLLVDKVIAYGTAGGTNSGALHDSAGNDVFTGTGNEALLMGTGYSLELLSFQAVTAYATSGINKKNVSTISYAFVAVGPWS